MKNVPQTAEMSYAGVPDLLATPAKDEMLNELAKTGLGKTVIGKEKLTVFSGHLGVPAWIRNKLPTLLRIGVHVFVEGISRNAPIKCMLGNTL